MKPNIQTSFLAIIVLMAFNLFGYFHDWSYNAEKDRELTEKSVYVFDGNLEILRREYRDRTGFAVTDEEIINKSLRYGKLGYTVIGEDIVVNRMPKKDPDATDTKTIHSIHYLASFHADSVIKGNKEDIPNLRWAYTNSSISMCPAYPKSFPKSEKFRFFILEENKEGLVYKLEYMSLPDDKNKKSERDADANGF